MRIRETLLTIRPDEFPNVAAASDAFLSGEPLDKFDWAIDVMIDGIVAGRLPVPRKTGTRSKQKAPP